MKKIALLVLISFFSMLVWGQATEKSAKKIIFKFDIKQEIGPVVWRHTLKSLNEAKKVKADYILIHMNTYGGAVDAADSVRTALLNIDIPVMVFVDNNAASAGALISIACDSIYMRPGANIGAATVVDGSGKPMPDKYQSYMRSMMRSTCEAHGKDTIILGNDTTIVWHRDPLIAQAMVDPDKFVKNVSDSGEVLTMTASEAIKNHFCEGTANSIEEVIALAGIKNYEIIEHKVSSLDKLIDILVSPYLSGILIMIMLGGIYFELQSPGIGFPLAAAALAAVLYFAPLYLEGMAENWEIVLFAVGVILLMVEIFAIPGFGVAGISGIILMIVSLTLSMVDNTIFTAPHLGTAWLTPILKSWATVMVSMVLGLVLAIWSANKLLPESGMLSFAILKASTSAAEGFVSFPAEKFDLVGKIAISATVLRPAGKVEFENEIYDAVAISGFIEKGKDVKVIKYETGALHVRKV